MSPHDIVALAKDLAVRIGKSRVLGVAAEMSFWLFLALVPLASVAGLVIARLAVHNWNAASELFSPLPRVARELLVNEVSTVATWNGSTVAPTAIVTFLWLASSGVHAVFDAMELETGCERPWWKKRLIALASCVVLPIGFAVVTLLGTGLSWVWHVMGSVDQGAADAINTSPLAVVARFVVGALVLFGLLSALFWVGVPPAARRDMPVVPGVILVIVLESILGYGYGFYIAKAGIGGAYQAGLAAIGVTMTAIYLFSVALLIGLALNVEIRDRRRRTATST